MLSYDFLNLLGLWDKIFIHIDLVQKKLKDSTMNFEDAVMDLKALRDHFSGAREVLISESVEEGLSLCQEWEVEVERRRRRKKRMSSENSRDTGLTAKEEMERVMKGTLDRLNREMDDRFQRLHDTDSKFGFLLNVHGLCYCTVSKELHMQENCKKLGEFYSIDIDGQQLYEEILDCRMQISGRPNTRVVAKSFFLKSSQASSHLTSSQVKSQVI
ncbi:hypothetical protein HOLleu_08215 [Holothuria leucospilota]|uniref:Uncharacterized protein n=1 Tax=Holothuria leucospilota TaxID=206669 RepID=A0A9Q1CH56_HOLLE|nr:hypothetical protein HOLleu_08215 [Holothuria leucospilota]